MKRIPGSYRRCCFFILGIAMLVFQLACSSKDLKIKNGATLDQMGNYFVNPPDSVKPWVFWQWMNGNITKEGITLDLEAMKRMGIGGALCFNNAVGITRGPVDYASDKWFDMTEFAVKEARRLGLKIMFHNSPGYSGTGGPWVTPEMSMQELVWSETQISQSKSIKVVLDKPYARMNYYKDAFILAYPSLPDEKGLMKDYISSLTVNDVKKDKSVLCDNNPETKIRLNRKDNQNEVIFQFDIPYKAQSITVYRTVNEEPNDLFDGPRDHPPYMALEVSHDGTEYSKVASWGMPQLREGNTPGMQNFKPVEAKYYKLIASSPTWLSEVELHGAVRLAGWPGKADFTHGNSGGTRIPICTKDVIFHSTIIDVTENLDENGQLNWEAPYKSDWTIVRLGHTTTGEENAAHPDSGAGLEIDKLNRAALDFQFEKFNSKIVERLKPYIGNAFLGFTTDSWECGKQNWSVVLPQEFMKRNNYDITSWVLALTGRIIDSEDATHKFLDDFNATQVEVLTDNYYGYWDQKCNEIGLQYHAEPYGDGTLDGLTACRYLDVPMCEFWTRHIYGSDKYSKQAVSGAHLYGKQVVAAESFTGMPLTSKWTAFPYALKAQGDYFYSLGVNRFAFHVFVHQPYTTGYPGMTMGPFGSHIDRNNTWTEQSYGWINYLSRCQYILQQGKAVIDACYFKGDEPSPLVPDVYPMMPDGYKCDVFGPDALYNRMRINDGKIVLPDGMQYQIAIMAPLNEIRLSTLKQFRNLVEAGMTLVVNNKPQKSYGNESTDLEVKMFVDKFYGNLDGEKVTKTKVGKGVVVWGEDLKTVFNTKNIRPDFLYSSENGDAVINHLHKIIGGEDVFFISNYCRNAEKITASFNIEKKLPELWNAETGEISVAPVYRFEDERTIIPFDLNPAESCFIVFRKDATAERNIQIKKGQDVVLSTYEFERFDPLKYEDVKNDFTISAWCKPETYAHRGRGFLIHPVQGSLLFGKEHAICGIGVGTNGVFVYENNCSLKTILTYDNPIQGWNYLSLVYKKGIPSLYINGELVAKGVKSKFIVHPGFRTGMKSKEFNNWFEGDCENLEVDNKAFSDKQIRDLGTGKLAYLKQSPEVKLLVNNQHNVLAEFIENGKYSVSINNDIHQIIDITQCSSEDISNQWKIQFPKESGIKKTFDMPVLKSLIKCSDFDVQHFSGTCIYHRVFRLDSILDQTKIMIDLGRVEVIAKVFVNGTEAGLLWKPPFQLDITGLVQHGVNSLRIEVTTLWINRLIGDENLPVENNYSVHNYIEKLPDWYINNELKPGKRKTFSVWKNYSKDKPLVESGLLGPVSVIVAEKRVIVK
ncbi:glycosyl hydrolase [Geofilum sp. OHC36d9]|uniref:glycosyl hydrolase n=1 Tax=Geofilum sp. OHC36d9 TaxID=3458413 RepID=UPI0040331617